MGRLDTPNSDRVAEDQKQKESMPSREMAFRPKDTGSCAAGVWNRGSMCAPPIISTGAPWTEYRNGGTHVKMG